MLVALAMRRSLRAAGHEEVPVHPANRGQARNDDNPVGKRHARAPGYFGRLFARHLSFVVRRSSFVVRRSSFVVRRSSFVVRRSSFVVVIIPPSPIKTPAEAGERQLDSCRLDSYFGFESVGS